MIGLFPNLSLIYLSLRPVILNSQFSILPPKADPPLAGNYFFAEVVKLANTLRSGRSGRKLLRVQLSSSASLNYKLVEMMWVPAPKERGSLSFAERQLPPSADFHSRGMPRHASIAKVSHLK